MTTRGLGRALGRDEATRSATFSLGRCLESKRTPTFGRGGVLEHALIGGYNWLAAGRAVLHFWDEPRGLEKERTIQQSPLLSGSRFGVLEKDTPSPTCPSLSFVHGSGALLLVLIYGFETQISNLSSYQSQRK